MYFEKALTSQLYIRDATFANPYSILVCLCAHVRAARFVSRSFSYAHSSASARVWLQLFGGDITVQHEQGTITVDDWIVYSAAARIAVLAKSIRTELDHLLQKKIARPETDITNSAVIGAIVQLLVAPY